ncbi:RNA-binding S4 domain-containing protein [Brevundimonas sp. NPDC090276]|uniref:RNA-binding S4 domain-containing protein n=1 Tax=Brevundimonas sp. NPDC090276 TaxID=3363956 RepID=UPI00383B21D1
MTSAHEAVQSCRIDLWLWRARFAKTRSLAADMVERGAIRLTHHGVQTRLDKPSRSVHPGDDILFAQGGRLIAVRVLQLGERRGPPEEARALYAALDAPGF